MCARYKMFAFCFMHLLRVVRVIPQYCSVDIEQVSVGAIGIVEIDQ